MLASNTQPAAVVAKAFNQSIENVFGDDDDLDISEKIRRFCELLETFQSFYLVGF